MPNIKRLISQISRKIADRPPDEVWISEFDLEYAYYQLQLSKKQWISVVFAVISGYLLPIPGMVLRVGKYENHILGKNRRNFETQSPS